MNLFEQAEVIVPEGPHDIEEQREWGVIYGGHLRGTGGILDNSLHKPNKGSRWIHKFNKTLPTLLYQGFGGSVERMTFDGEGADCGILVDKADSSGFGTGKLHLSDVAFVRYAKAIQLGDDPADANADQLTIGRIHTNGCGTLLRVEHEQGVDIRIYGVARPYTTPLVFDMEGGGNLDVSVLYCMYGVKEILKTGSRVGSNNAEYTFRKVVCDTNNDVPIFLRQGRRCAGMEVTFESVRIGNSAAWPTEPIFQLQGGSSLTLNRFKYLRPGHIKYTNSIVEKYKNHIHLLSVTTGVTNVLDLFHPDSKGEVFVTVGRAADGFGNTTLRPGLYHIKDGKLIEHPDLITDWVKRNPFA